MARASAPPDTWWTDVAMGIVTGAVAGTTDAWYQNQPIAPHAVFGVVWFAMMLPLVGWWRRRRRRNVAGA